MKMSRVVWWIGAPLCALALALGTIWGQLGFIIGGLVCGLGSAVYYGYLRCREDLPRKGR